MAIENYRELFTLITRSFVPDGLSGETETWRDRLIFYGGISLKQSTEIRESESEKVFETYDLNVPLDVPIKFGDILRRHLNGTLLRVTSNISDMIIPSSALNQYKMFTLEPFIYEVEEYGITNRTI